MRTPHKWADVIKAAADGYEIECRLVTIKTWAACNFFQFINIVDNEFAEFRVKPEKVYPVTSMTDKELLSMHTDLVNNSLSDTNELLKNIANAAIKRYIDDTEGGK